MTKRDELKEAAIVAWAQAQEVPEMSALVMSLEDYKLTKAERKILAVKLLPQAPGLSDREMADLAKVSERHWYRVHAKEHFRLIAAEASKRYLGHKIPEITSAFVRDARFGNDTNQRAMMQQCGVLDKPEKAGDTNIALTVTIEEKKIINKEIDESRNRWAESLGYTLSTDN